MADFEPIIEVEEDEVEVVEGLPVLIETREVPVAAGPPQQPSGLPVAQTAAVAVGSFVAGAATAAVVARHVSRLLNARSRRPVVARRNAGPQGPEELEVASVRSFFIEVHALARRGE